MSLAHSSSKRASWDQSFPEVCSMPSGELLRELDGLPVSVRLHLLRLTVLSFKGFAPEPELNSLFEMVYQRLKESAGSLLKTGPTGSTDSTA